MGWLDPDLNPHEAAKKTQKTLSNYSLTSMVYPSRKMIADSVPRMTFVPSSKVFRKLITIAANLCCPPADTEKVSKGKSMIEL